MPLSMAISLSQLDQDVVDPLGDDAVVNGHLSLLVSFTNPLAAGCSCHDVGCVNCLASSSA